MAQRVILTLESGQLYQLPGGLRQRIVSVTPDDSTLDPVLVLQNEGGGLQIIASATEFMAKKPELVN